MVINGTDANDSLTGTAFPDTINGMGGADQIDGGPGDDSIDGGADGDNLYGGLGNDTVLGGLGDDRYYGYDGDDFFQGGAGNDWVRDWQGQNDLRGGDGNDTIDCEDGGYHSDNTLSGGNGQDSYVLYGISGVTGTFRVSDLAVGTGGDLIDVNHVLTDSVGYTGGNPFSQGYLRLVQAGADTVLQWDRDGGGSTYDWATSLTLGGVTTTDLTAENFAGRIDPTGLTDAGEDTAGTGVSDTLIGGVMNDTLSGLGGADQLDGGPGNDSIDGGADDDYLLGGLGDDTVLGSGGNDRYYGYDGDDQFLGGAGDDWMRDWQGHNDLRGGDGNDTIDCEDGGYLSDNTLGGGEGQDLYELYGISGVTGTFRVRDFVAGTGGDLIDVNHVLTDSAGYSGGNPFAQGYLRLVQSDTDTLLQWDRDGAGATHDWATLLTLTGETSGDLTAANFVDSIDPGLGDEGEALTGSDVNETLLGGVMNDTISGLGGADQLDGGPGDDSIDGGADADYLLGGLGNDTVLGGDGDDRYYGYDGDDSFAGGAGNDWARDWQGHNDLAGGDGNDTIDCEDGGYHSDNTLSGGNGQDSYVLYGISGVTGTFHVSDFAAGAGGDVIDVNHVLTDSAGYTGGNPFSQGYLRLVQSGADTVLQWDRDGAGASYDWRAMLTLQNVTASSVTAANFGQLLIGTDQDDTLVGGFGDDTIIAKAGDDLLNGGAGADSMEGDAGDDFYYVNVGGDAVVEALDEGTDTVRSTISYTLGDNVEDLTLAGAGAINGTGNGEDNDIAGNAAANIIVGAAGADTLEGFDGNDTVNGGDGDDLVIGGSGKGDDRYTGGAGIDTLRYSSAKSAVTVDATAGTASGVDVGNDTFSSFERFLGGAGNDSFTGNGAANLIYGANGADTLKGMGGADTLQGGNGADRLTGGQGNDRFVFAEAPAAAKADTITDFVHNSDKIALDDVVFTALRNLGPLTHGEFGTYVTYNAGTGQLFYDADAGGTGAAILVATLTSAPALAATDIVVI